MIRRQIKTGNMNSRRTTTFKKKSTTQMCEMFQLSPDTLLPVWRCCEESITGERWEWTAGGWQGAYRTLEWKMWKRWMERSGMSLRVSQENFPLWHISHLQWAGIQSKWLVGSMIMWFSGVTFDSGTALQFSDWHYFVPSCLYFKQVESSGNTATFVIMTFELSLQPNRSFLQASRFHSLTGLLL